MGPSYRKSLSAGPFRFNLSGAGIGVSVGSRAFASEQVRGGNYVSISKGGFTYRAKVAQDLCADHRDRWRKVHTRNAIPRRDQNQ
ncbi:DUF4236 domain-containing protein [Paraburkholderia sediminicola]|uniref:DUF4236 domain-containing protein n=1 Tax=Paraburkholderia sediminicola TaxID=458836 RepID=UPI0038B90EA6